MTVAAGVRDEPVQVPLLVESYLTHLTVERGRSARTTSAYRADLRRFCAFLVDRGVDVVAAAPADLEAWAVVLRQSALADSTVTRMLVSVRGLYRYLLAEGQIDVDPGVEVELPGRADSLPKALSAEDVSSMLDAAAASGQQGDPLGLRDSALLEFLYATGARVSEACGLGFGDLDMDAGLARLLGKRNKERLVPIGKPALRAMAGWLDAGRPRMVSGAASRDDMDAIFLGVRGRRLSRQAAWTSIRRWAAEAGVSGEVSPHVLRHSCATHLLEGGADIRTVAELLGHASVSTTQIYTRVATDRLFDAYRDAHPRARGRG